MKLTIDAKVLAAAVAQCREAIDARPSRPALGNLFLEVTGDKLKLTGSNESMSITRSLDAAIEEPGRLCVPDKYFSDIITKLSGEVMLTSENTQLEIVTSSSNYTLNGISSEDYPVMPSLDGGQEFMLKADAIAAGIEFTVPMVSSDESKQVLTGLHMNLSPTGLTFAATDGHRLSVHPLEVEQVETLLTTIPGRAARLVPKLFPEGDIGIIFGDTLIQFFNAESVFITRVMEGQYPQFGQLIPSSFSKMLRLDRKALATAISRVMVLASLKNDIVKLEINQGAITLSAETAEVGKGVEALEGDFEGDYAIAFNGKYLLEATKIFDDQDLILNMNEPTKPVVIRGGGSPDTVLYLLMPIQIRPN